MHQEMNEQHCSQQEIVHQGTSQVLWDRYWATCEGTGWPGHRQVPKLKVVPISTIQVLAHQGKQRDLCSVPSNRTMRGNKHSLSNSQQMLGHRSPCNPIICLCCWPDWLALISCHLGQNLGCAPWWAAGHQAMPTALCPLPGPSSTTRLEPRDDTSGKLLAPSTVQNPPQGIICPTALASIQLQNYWWG